MQRSGERMVSRQQAHRGLSLLECMGGLTAITSGLLLGTFYLGVDIKTTTLELLLKSELVEPQWLGVVADDSEAPPAGRESGRAEQFVDNEKPGLSPVVTDTRVASSRSYSLVRTPTWKFWSRLLQTMQHESTGRHSNRRGPLYEYLTSQQLRHREAADAISILGQPGKVDERVLAYAEYALQWHQSGIDLYQKAMVHVTVAPTSKWSGPFARSWQNEVTQHRMEEKLLLSKQQAVANYLGYSFGARRLAR